MFVVSEKRDAVGTGQIVATGKIAGIAVLRNTSNQLSVENAGAGFKKKFLLCQ
jgi:hypothetical protein